MKKFKKILSFCLIVCICFCAVGCNKVTDTNSSSLSSTITEIETETVIVEEESSTNDTTTDESKVETTVSGTPSENTTPSTTTTSSTTIPSQESTPSSSETPTTSKDPNAPLTDEELKEFMPDWFFEYPAREIVDIYMLEVAYRAGLIECEFLVITTQNELYKFSPDKLFSNGSHFKKVESDIKVIKFWACTHTYAELCRDIFAPILTTDNKILIYNPKTDKIETHPWLQTSGCTYDECPTDYKNLFTASQHSYYSRLSPCCVGAIIGVRYKDNNILSLDNEILYSFPQDETIISAATHIVQTTKGYYYIHAKTEQEFADSEPVTTYSAEFIGTKPEDRFIKFFRENS